MQIIAAATKCAFLQAYSASSFATYFIKFAGELQCDEKML